MAFLLDPREVEQVRPGDWIRHKESGSKHAPALDAAAVPRASIRGSTSSTSAISIPARRSAARAQPVSRTRRK